MRLSESIFMVGSGPFGLSHEFDCNVYIINCGGSLVMIDTGAGCNTKTIIENIKKDGLDPENIDHILLTHSHADHGGGAALIKNLYSLEVCISEIEAECLASDDESMIKLDVAKRSGLYSPEYTFSPCDASVLLKNKDRIEINGFTFEAIEVPGHSQGSICYQVRLAEGIALFTGDVVFYDGTIGMLNCDGSDLSEYRKNIHRISCLNIDLLLPGHFVFVLSDGQKHIDKAVKALSLLGIPKNFI